jgi:hypothetical protein
LLEERSTVAPPAGAGPLKAKIPSEPVPPVTDGGLRVIDFAVGGSIVKPAVLVLGDNVADIVSDVADDTALVVTVKVALLEPAGTETL